MSRGAIGTERPPRGAQDGRGAQPATPVRARGSVLITGCSTGIGRETALALAAQGWEVFATVRGEQARISLQSDLDGVAAGSRVVEMDVADQHSVEAGLKEVLAATDGRLDALVNNAGFSVIGPFEEIPPETVSEAIETNLVGAMRVTRAALPALRASGDARIVIMSSVMGVFALPGFSVYSATKFALEGWAESLSHEVAPLGVRVTLLEPGPYRTHIYSSARIASAPNGPYTGVRRWLGTTYVKRIESRARHAGEVARAVARTLDSRRPPLRRTVGPMARRVVRMKRLVPFRAIARVLRRETAPSK